MNTLKISALAFSLIIWNSFLYGQDYISYQTRVNQAETNILDSNYNKAILIYDSLFKEYDFVFAKHCYTAIQLAVEQKKWDLAFEFIEKGVKQGITVKIIENSPVMKNIINNDSWGQFKERKYDSLRKIYLSNINLSLRDEIEKLFALDQYYTSRVNDSRFIKYLFNDLKWKKEIGKIVDNKLIAIIKKYGFPGEKIIGIREEKIRYSEKAIINEELMLNRLEEGKGYIGNLSAQYMLIHYFSNSHPNFNDLLLEEVKKGNIEPYQYASICDFQAKYGKKYKNEGYYNQWHRDVSVEKREEINKRRLSIGLETFEELKRKEKRNWEIREKINSGNVNHIKIWTIWGGY